MLLARSVRAHFLHGAIHSRRLDFVARSSAVQRDGEEAHAGAIASDSMVYVTTRGIASMLVQRAISFVTHDSRCGFAGRGLLRGATELMMFEKFAIQRVLVKARAICLCSRHLGKTFVVVSSIASSRCLSLRREEELDMGIACTMRAVVRLFMQAHAIYPCPLLRRVRVIKRVLSWFQV